MAGQVVSRVLCYPHVYPIDRARRIFSDYNQMSLASINVHAVFAPYVAYEGMITPVLAKLRKGVVKLETTSVSPENHLIFAGKGFPRKRAEGVISNYAFSNLIPFQEVKSDVRVLPFVLKDTFACQLARRYMLENLASRIKRGEPDARVQEIDFSWKSLVLHRVYFPWYLLDFGSHCSPQIVSAVSPERIIVHGSKYSLFRSWIELKRSQRTMQKEEQELLAAESSDYKKGGECHST